MFRLLTCSISGRKCESETESPADDILTPIADISLQFDVPPKTFYYNRATTKADPLPIPLVRAKQNKVLDKVKKVISAFADNILWPHDSPDKKKTERGRLFYVTTSKHWIKSFHDK